MQLAQAFKPLSLPVPLLQMMWGSLAMDVMVHVHTMVTCM